MQSPMTTSEARANVRVLIPRRCRVLGPEATRTTAVKRIVIIQLVFRISEPLRIDGPSENPLKMHLRSKLRLVSVASHGRSAEVPRTDDSRIGLASHPNADRGQSQCKPP